MRLIQKTTFSTILVLALSTTSLHSQNLMSYEELDSNSKNQKEVDWNNLKGDLSLNFWCKVTQKNIFYENDMNNDKLLSIRDLAVYNEENVTNWSRQFLSGLFTFWSPDYDSHIENLKMKFDSISDSHPDLSITKDAYKSVKDIMEKTNLSQLSMNNVYIKTNVRDSEVIKEGYTDTGRKWVTIKNTLYIEIFKGDEKQKYSFDILMNIIRKYQNHKFDSKYALIEMGID
jgi:hypothetical protein